MDLKKNFAFFFPEKILPFNQGFFYYQALRLSSVAVLPTALVDSIVIKLGQDACLRHNSDVVDGSGERSRAILALLFEILLLTRI
jgi:hypothetical protein